MPSFVGRHSRVFQFPPRQIRLLKSRCDIHVEIHWNQWSIFGKLAGHCTKAFMLSPPRSILLSLPTCLAKIDLREINICVKLVFRRSTEPSYQQNLTCAPNTSSLFPSMEANANANAPVIRLQPVQLVTFLISSEFTITYTYTFPFMILIVFWFKMIGLYLIWICMQHIKQRQQNNVASLQ